MNIMIKLFLLVYLLIAVLITIFNVVWILTAVFKPEGMTGKTLTVKLQNHRKA